MWCAGGACWGGGTCNTFCNTLPAVACKPSGHPTCRLCRVAICIYATYSESDSLLPWCDVDGSPHTHTTVSSHALHKKTRTRDHAPSTIIASQHKVIAPRSPTKIITQRARHQLSLVANELTKNTHGIARTSTARHASPLPETFDIYR